MKKKETQKERANKIIAEWDRLVQDSDNKNIIPMLVSEDRDAWKLAEAVLKNHKYHLLAQVCKDAYFGNRTSSLPFTFDTCRATCITMEAWSYIRGYIYYTNIDSNADSREFTLSHILRGELRQYYLTLLRAKYNFKD